MFDGPDELRNQAIISARFLDRQRRSEVAHRYGVSDKRVAQMCTEFRHSTRRKVENTKIRRWLDEGGYEALCPVRTYWDLS